MISARWNIRLDLTILREQKHNHPLTLAHLCTQTECPRQEETDSQDFLSLVSS
jgi:hypothetical protein